MVLPVGAPKVGSGRDHLQWHRVNVAAPTHVWDEASATESASDLNWTGGKEAGDVRLAKEALVPATVHARSSSMLRAPVEVRRKRV